jgi:hypothetical protein
MARNWRFSPVGAPTDPSRLWAYQIERRKQWDMIYLIIIVLSLTAPIGFAITRSQLSQVLKISYPFFALFIAWAALGLVSATSFLSALFSLAACILVVVILMPGIQWVIGMSPSPEWYVFIIPLLVLLFLATESFIPQKEHFEWETMNLSPHGLNKQQLSIIHQKGFLGTSAQKVFTNISSVRPESLWIKLLRSFLERQNSEPGRTGTKKSASPLIRVPNLDGSKSSAPSPKPPSIEHLDELYALQRQADDSLQQIKTPDSTVGNTTPISLDTIPSPRPLSTPHFQDNPAKSVDGDLE